MVTTVYSDALICTQALQLPTHNLRPVVENSAEGLLKFLQVGQNYAR